MSFSDHLYALDRYQQRHRRLSFLAAVIRKFNDDQAGQLAALIAYYAFFALFPLLLVFVTVLGFVLEGNTSAQNSVLHSTLGQYPIIGEELQHNIHSLKGNVVGLGIGVVGSLLAGLGITGAVQNAFSQVWHVPRKDRPSFLILRLRGIWQLIVLGVLFIVSTLAAGYVTAQTPSGALAALAAILLALAANLLLFFLAFRLFTTEQVPTRDLIAGVIVGAVLWQILQHIGGYYVAHVVRHAKETSALFAFVLGLLSWLYIGSRVVVFAAEINVVRARRLWPRSFVSQPLLEADKRALVSSAGVGELVDEQNVEVNFEGAGGKGDPAGGPSPPS